MTRQAQAARTGAWHCSRQKFRLGNWSRKESTEHGTKVPCSVLFFGGRTWLYGIRTGIHLEQECAKRDSAVAPRSLYCQALRQPPPCRTQEGIQYEEISNGKSKVVCKSCPGRGSSRRVPAARPRAASSGRR